MDQDTHVEVGMSELSTHIRANATLPSGKLIA